MVIVDGSFPTDGASRHEAGSLGTPSVAALRRRRGRPFRRRRPRRLAPRTPRPRPLTLMSDAERRRRIDRIAAYLVRTMRACPAPGIAPLSTRDWLLIVGAAVLPYVIVYSLAAVAPR